MHGNNAKGVIMIAHGSPDPVWVQMIQEVVKHVHIPFPIVPAFLEEKNGDLSIASAIAYLEGLGIRHILVVPLFISSYTTHIEEIKYMLGLIKMPDGPVGPAELPVIPHCSHIQFCSPLNDHRLVVEILMEHIKELYVPENDEIVLVAHGVNDSKISVQYTHLLQSLQQIISEQLAEIYPTVPVHPVHYATFYPKTLESVVEQVARKKTPLILPFFLSEGYFTKILIPEKLRGLPYKYAGKTLLPHKNISFWIDEQIQKMILEKNSRP